MLSMGLLGSLDGIALGEVEELRMEGFIGFLEPKGAGSLTFLARMPALTSVITTDNSEEKLHSALDHLSRRATVVRVDR